MRAQAARGHRVGYVFAGRHYPWSTRTRLSRWASDGVVMYELLGSAINTHWSTGTRYPDLDLQEPESEAAFARVLEQARPDVVHFQELAGLPSSLLEQAKGGGIPVVLTLHDYYSVCPTARLLDRNGERCLRHEVGEDCERNCASAPAGYGHLIEETLRYELRRSRRAVPVLTRISDQSLEPAIRRLKELPGRQPPGGLPVAHSLVAGHWPSPAAFQRRRDVNVARLRMCDRLIAPSTRAAEIYALLGVDRERVTVQRLTLPHLERLTARRGPEVGAPVTFVTLGACGYLSKGSRAIVEAVRELERAGRGADYRLLIMGWAEPAVEKELSRIPSVSLLGPYQPDDLDLTLDSADVGIVPSIWEETHGFVGVEMLAKGLPVIGSALGGIPEYVIPGETGWLNRSATGAELAAIMQAALDAPTAIEQLRRSVREKRDSIVRPMATHVAEVEALYAELMDR